MAPRHGSKSSLLEFAVLGLLQESPMHGYELRKRLNGVLGTFRAISYGSLYPCLKSMESASLITSANSTDESTPALTGKRRTRTRPRIPRTPPFLTSRRRSACSGATRNS